MKYDRNYFRMLDTDGLINEGRDSMDELAIVLADRLGEMQDNHSKMLAVMCEMLGAAETDLLDETSNVWRSAMNDARTAIAKTK